MPYYRYAGMADRDARDLVAYLRTLPASVTANRPAEGELPLPRLAYRAWRLLFAGRTQAPAEAPAVAPPVTVAPAPAVVEPVAPAEPPRPILRKLPSRVEEPAPVAPVVPLTPVAAPARRSAP